MFKTARQKLIKYRNTFDASIDKNDIPTCINSKTKSYTEVYQNLKDCWKTNSKYKQVSLGRNHTERSVIVVDDDERNIGEAMKNFHNKNMPLPNMILENPTSHHTQSFYFLDKPAIVKTCHVTKRGTEEVLEKSNGPDYPLYKKVSDMMNFLAGDPNFTCWRCKNPFNDYFEVIEVSNNTYSLNTLYNAVKETYDLEKTLYDSIHKKEVKKELSNHNTTTFKELHTSESEAKPDTTFTKVIIDGIECRYDPKATEKPSRTITMLEMASSILYDHRDWSETQLLNFMKKNSYEICREVGKPSLDENEIESIVKSSYSYFLSKKGNCRYTKEQSKNGNKIKNIKKLIRINKIRKDICSQYLSTFKERYSLSTEEICEKYDIKRAQFFRDKKLLENKEELLKMAEEAKTFIDNNRGCYNINENIKYIKQNENEILELIHDLKEELCSHNNTMINKRYSSNNEYKNTDLVNINTNNEGDYYERKQTIECKDYKSSDMLY